MTVPLIEWWRFEVQPTEGFRAQKIIDMWPDWVPAIHEAHVIKDEFGDEVAEFKVFDKEQIEAIEAYLEAADWVLLYTYRYGSNR